MAGFVRLNDESVKVIFDNLLEHVGTGQNILMDNVTLNLSYEEKRQCHVLFTPLAYTKMWALVDHYPGEVGWHGTVERVGDNTFVITDILVYPQNVSSATVQTEDVDYAQWLVVDLEDEVFNKNRFHGHSHVSMGVLPSTTDISHQKNLLSTVNDDDFYIFMIVNKKRDIFVKVFDMKNNIRYSNEVNKDEILMDVVDNESTISAWLEDNSAKITKTSTTYSYNSNSYKTWENGYWRGVWVGVKEAKKLHDEQVELVSSRERAKRDRKTRKKDTVAMIPHHSTSNDTTVNEYLDSILADEENFSRDAWEDVFNDKFS